MVELRRQGLEGLGEASLRAALRFANAAAALITTRKGALRVMPAVSEVEALLTAAQANSL